MIHRITLVTDIELPPAIVWDALVDPELLEGWLGAVPGDVAEIEPPVRLRTVGPADGDTTFELEPIEGGLRGMSTRLRVTADSGRGHAAGELRALWRDRLDALEELLRGHPRR